MHKGPSQLKMAAVDFVSPYLRQPRRSFAQAVADSQNARRVNALARLRGRGRNLINDGEPFPERSERR